MKTTVSNTATLEDRGYARHTLSASTLSGDKVVNTQNEDIGKIQDLMIDLRNGRVAYAVLAFGGFLGLGDKYFAVPWQALRVDQTNHQVVIDANKATLEKAPGFDKDRWPDMNDPEWATEIHAFYRVPYER